MMQCVQAWSTVGHPGERKESISTKCDYKQIVNSVLPAKQEVHSLILSDLTHLFQGISVAWLVNVLPAK